MQLILHEDEKVLLIEFHSNQRTIRVGENGYSLRCRSYFDFIQMWSNFPVLLLMTFTSLVYRYPLYSVFQMLFVQEDGIKWRELYVLWRNIDLTCLIKTIWPHSQCIFFSIWYKVKERGKRGPKEQINIKKEISHSVPKQTISKSS